MANIQNYKVLLAFVVTAVVILSTCVRARERAYLHASMHAHVLVCVSVQLLNGFAVFYRGLAQCRRVAFIHNLSTCLSIYLYIYLPVCVYVRACVCPMTFSVPPFVRTLLCSLS